MTILPICPGSHRPYSAILNKGPGFEFDAPVTLMKKHPGTVPPDALLNAAHVAHKCISEKNDAQGIVIRYVGVDLTGTKMAGNSWNGLRITDQMLDGCTAAMVPITLTRVSVIDNGRHPTADGGALRETVGIAIERSAAGSSRLASLSPANWRAAVASLNGNQGGDFADDAVA